MQKTRFVTVSNQSELRVALEKRTADTVIVLKEGQYGEVTFNARESGLPIKLIAADASKPPVFQTLNISNANGVSIDGAQFTPKEGVRTASGLTLRNCDDVVLTHNNFVGGKGAMDAQQRGISVIGSTNVVVDDNNFTGLMRGAVISETNGVKLINNDVTAMRSEGFNLAGVKNVEIAHNKMGDFHPQAGDHPDFIQFWTRGTKTVSENISIHDNQLIQANGVHGVQGIFMDNDERVAYKNVTIENNLIQSGAPHGILLEMANGVKVTNNVAVAVEGSIANVAISVTQSTQVVVSGNLSNAIGTSLSYGAQATDNVLTIKQVSGLKPLTSAEIADLRYEAAFVRGTDASDRMTGTNRSEIMLGGAGNDTISGGRGDDTIVGGAGDDALGGGTGADTFVFFGVEGRGRQTDRIGDFSFADGDKLVFSDFAVRQSEPGAAPSVKTILTEIDTIKELVDFGKLDAVEISRRGKTDTLIIQITETNGDVLEVQISNLFTQFAQAGGQLG